MFHPLFKWAQPTMPNVNIVKQTRDKYVLSWIMYIWHETLIFCHTFCMVAKAIRDPFYKIDWLTDSIKTKSWDNIHYCIIFEQNDIFFPLRSCFFCYAIFFTYYFLQFHMEICLPFGSGIVKAERIYNPITAMGFSAMFTFQLDNTKR